MTLTDIPAIDIQAIDEAKLEGFVGQAVVDMGAAISGLLLHIGDRLGLYKAMAGAGPITSADAGRTHRHHRALRPGMARQPGGRRLRRPTTRPMAPTTLPAEQAMVSRTRTARSSSAGAFETIASCYADHDVFVEAFRTGAGSAGTSTTTGCSPASCGFRPGYAAHLVEEWLPALDGVVEKLRAGASVADVGCGLGASTIIMAEAFERSTFVGFDIHEPSSTAARTAAAEAGVSRRARFDVATAKDFPARATTWCACSTPCTTWVTRSGWRAASGRLWRRTARCCWSSRTPATGSRTT